MKPTFKIHKKDIKKEIFDQLEGFFNNERLMSTENCLIDATDSIMERIIRLDSYVKQSQAFKQTGHSRFALCDHSSSNYLKPQISSSNTIPCCSKLFGTNLAASSMVQWFMQQQKDKT